MACNPSTKVSVLKLSVIFKCLLLQALGQCEIWVYEWFFEVNLPSFSKYSYVTQPNLQS